MNPKLEKTIRESESIILLDKLLKNIPLATEASIPRTEKIKYIGMIQSRKEYLYNKRVMERYRGME